MAVEAATRFQVSLSPGGHNVGGMRSSAARFAVKTSLFSQSVHLQVPPYKKKKRPVVVRTGRGIYNRVTSKEAFICRDCGYIYQDKTPFDKLPDKYFCPVCGAPKRRFRPYQPKVAKNANATDTRKERKAQLQRDEAIGKALPIAIGAGAVALVALYFYINSIA